MNIFEKIMKRLEEESDYEPIEYDCDDTGCVDEQKFIATDEAKKIVQEVAEEYNNGWIPCSGCKNCQYKECEHYGEI